MIETTDGPEIIPKCAQNSWASSKDWLGVGRGDGHVFQERLEAPGYLQRGTPATLAPDSAPANGLVRLALGVRAGVAEAARDSSSLRAARPSRILPLRMRARSKLRLRIQRGFSLGLLGPNEARLLFDAAAAGTALALALGIRWLFTAEWSPSTSWLLPPATFVGCNFLLGVYGRLRRATAAHKALALAGSTLVASLTGLASGLEGREVLVWWLLTTMPVVLSRFLLAASRADHKVLRRITVNEEGPVLVIGGAGYIGSHTVELLLRRGHRVRVLDRLMYGSEPLAAFASNRAFELVQGDATEIGKLTAVARGANAVVHLAGLVGDPACALDPGFTRHANIVATRLAKEVAVSLGVKRFVFASSCSVYGDSDVEVAEDGPLLPLSMYAQTKIDSERELLHGARDDFFVTILRFATVFGHSHRPRFDLVANLFTAQAVASGEVTVIGPEQWRPFVHARDLARAVVTILETEPSLVQSQIFNVGDRRLNMTMLQLAEVVQRVVSRHRPVRISVRDSPGDRRNYAVSFAKIFGQLGFEAETSLEDGIAEMADRLASGAYGDYRAVRYSNLETTRAAVDAFHDPMNQAQLYGPLAAVAPSRESLLGTETAVR